MSLASNLFRILLLGFCIGFTSWPLPAAPAKPLLHPLFSNEAILQRGKPLAVWGWAAPGAPVTVSLSGAGLAAQPVTVNAGPDGRWQAALGPFTAGGPYVLSASSGDAKAEAREVLIGDVWLCSGQSNMQIRVKEAMDFEIEKAKADLPRIRHFFVPRRKETSPQELVQGEWKVCSPDTVGEFTAVGFFFARKLLEDFNVPIGLVHSSYGGTTAESWTSAEGLAVLPEEAKPLAEYQQLVKETIAQKERTGKDYAVLISEWYRANDPGTSATPPWCSTDYRAEGWAPLKLPGRFPNPGTTWLRREFNVLEAEAGKHARLKLGVIKDFDTAWVNGQKVGETENGGFYGIQRGYDIPPQVLKSGVNTVAIRVTARFGKSAFILSPDALNLAFDDGTSVPLAGEWQSHVGATLDQALPLPVRYDREQQPTSLFNAMIAPLIPMSMTGVIWYQGEENGSRAPQYRALLTGLIADWRSRFGQGDFPFLIVSLANWGGRQTKPEDADWAELREAQAMTAKTIAKGGLALAIDVGDAKDIHPKNKQEVGRRLALAAEAVAYGQPLEWSGPWFKSMTVDGASVVLTFDHLGGGLTTSDGATLAGFALAGEDQNFVWGEARIQGDTVVVSSPQVAKPVAVRYAWSKNPLGNLANKTGLPAVPFRTDTWPNKYPPVRN